MKNIAQTTADLITSIDKKMLDIKTNKRALIVKYFISKNGWNALSKNSIKTHLINTRKLNEEQSDQLSNDWLIWNYYELCLEQSMALERPGTFTKYVNSMREYFS